MKKNTFTFILGLILAISIFTLSAEASYFTTPYGGYGGYGSFYRPYYEQTQANSYFNTNRFSGQSNAFNDFTQTSSLDEFSNNAFTQDNQYTQGYLNSLSGNTLQTGSIALNDGFLITDGSDCLTDTITYNGDGKRNDYTLRRSVCDGITGRVFRNNQYNNALTTNARYNYNNLGLNTGNTNTQSTNGFTNSIDTSQQNTNSNQNKQLFVATSIGRGTRIILS